MTTFDVHVYYPEKQLSYKLDETVEGKNAKQAFNKARKILYNTHSSRIRVERQNDRAQA